ncbi:MAG: hypothetical protein GC204_03630 [Chloroflexi bacterium]|nr:hypothetical protein [Chloroflexota bacterium]
MKVPALSRTLIVTDLPERAAQLSCLLAEPNTYLAVVDSPRLAVHGDGETVRRNNAAARLGAKRVILVGLGADAEASLASRIPLKRLIRLSAHQDFAKLLPERAGKLHRTIVWGRDRVGIGLLQALRAGAMIEFADTPSPAGNVMTKSGHLVVCEEGESLSQVMAANYAFALGAGLQLIPEVPKAEAEGILEAFYTLYDPSDHPGSPTDRLQKLQKHLRRLCGELPLEQGSSITFISRHLPFGFGFPETPTTHLFSYPDLGISIVNGFAAEQPGARGINVTAMIDPEEVGASEIDKAAALLARRGGYVRAYRANAANVRAVNNVVELFPYDLLVFATHCGDADGYRWTYEYDDQSGARRRLVVDIALGIAGTSEREMQNVTQFMRFRSLDGVDWDDPQKETKIVVGTAIKDFMDQVRAKTELQPVLKEKSPRVLDSAALKMSDSNYIAIPRQLAGASAPIIINNACGSWRELASRFVFGGARAYLGTLFSVLGPEAEAIFMSLLGRHYGKPLAHALWSAQNEAYGDSVRRPYVITGVYPQRFRITPENSQKYIADRATAELASARKRLERFKVARNDFAQKHTEEEIRFYQLELKVLSQLVRKPISGPLR